MDDAAIEEEAHALRQMFFLLFAEAIERTIKGEDEIWLLERVSAIDSIAGHRVSK